jgi:hypothetical protein
MAFGLVPAGPVVRNGPQESAVQTTRLDTERVEACPRLRDRHSPIIGETSGRSRHVSDPRPHWRKPMPEAQRAAYRSSVP